MTESGFTLLSMLKKRNSNRVLTAQINFPSSDCITLFPSFSTDETTQYSDRKSRRQELMFPI